MRWLGIAGGAAAGGLLDRRRARARPSLKAHWNAQNVVPPNYKQDLLAFLRTYLNDPTHVRDAACRSRRSRRSAPASVTSLACATMRATSDGKYAGVKDGAAIYVSGKLDRFLDGQGGAASFARTRLTRRFPNWQQAARASAQRAPSDAQTAGPCNSAARIRSKRPKVARATRSLDLEVLRGCLSAILDELELNGLAFVQCAKAGTFNRRDVNEHILPAFLRLDEAIAFRRIEPLYGALRHA